MVKNASKAWLATKMNFFNDKGVIQGHAIDSQKITFLFFFSFILLQTNML